MIQISTLPVDYQILLDISPIGCILCNCQEKLVIHVLVNIRKTLTAILILVTFVGQTLAAPNIACHQSNQPNDAPVMMADMNHASHVMSDQSATKHRDSESTRNDCCDQDHPCSMGNCAVTVILPVETNLGYSSFSQTITPRSFTAISRPPTSLLRPPIFT